MICASKSQHIYINYQMIDANDDQLEQLRQAMTASAAEIERLNAALKQSDAEIERLHGALKQQKQDYNVKLKVKDVEIAELIDKLKTQKAALQKHASRTRMSDGAPTGAYYRAGETRSSSGLSA